MHFIISLHPDYFTASHLFCNDKYCLAGQICTQLGVIESDMYRLYMPNKIRNLSKYKEKLLEAGLIKISKNDDKTIHNGAFFVDLQYAAICYRQEEITVDDIVDIFTKYNHSVEIIMENPHELSLQ